MNTPSQSFVYPWPSAPEWAMWAATDEDGLACWFETQPAWLGREWANSTPHVGRVSRMVGVDLPPCPTWRDSLQARPVGGVEGGLVPEGWVLVPVAATNDMVEAAWDSDAADYVGEHKRIHSLGLAWDAMLAAAPAPPQVEPVSGGEAVAGAAWLDDGVSLVKHGSENEWCRTRGARRLYTHPAPMRERGAGAVAWEWRYRDGAPRWSRCPKEFYDDHHNQPQYEFRLLYDHPAPVRDRVAGEGEKIRALLLDALERAFRAGRNGDSYSAAQDLRDEAVPLIVAALTPVRTFSEAARWRHARHHALVELLSAYPTTDTSDTGLDYAVDTAIASTLAPTALNGGE